MLDNLGTLLFDQQRGDEAEPFLLESLRIKAELAAELPAETRYTEDLALGSTNHAILLRRAGRLEQAEEHCRVGLTLHQRLADDYPGMPNYRHASAWSLENLAVILHEQSRLPEAETSHRQAISLLEELVRQYPEASVYRVQLGQNYTNLGNLLRDRGDPRAAVELYDASIRALQPLHTRDSAAPMLRHNLQQAFWGRATAHTLIEQYAESVADWDRAIELDPGPLRASLRLSRATTLVRVGRTAEALAEADALVSPATTDLAILYNGAAVHALASASPTGATVQVESHAVRALELLRRAVAAGYKDASHLNQDPDFEPLRARDDFQEVLGEL